MEKLRLVILLGVFGFLSASCSSAKKIEAMKPEPNDASPLLYNTSPSFIDIPVQLNLRDIENQTNKLMTGLIYEDKDLSDDIAMSISKQAPLSLTNENGRIRTVFPMKALIKYRIGTDRLGISLSSVREFNLSGKITLLSEVALTNWKMSTKTQIIAVDWDQSPTTTILGKQVPITYIINPAIKFFKGDIAKKLDESIAGSMDFKENVLDAIEKICAPFQMNEQYDSWLRIVPIEIYSTQAQILQNNVRLEMGLKCTMETLIGQKPSSNFDRKSVVLKPVSKMSDHITANIIAVSTYQDASRIVSNNFAGQEFGSGNNKVKVNSVEMWHKSGKMIIAMNLSGSIDGTVYLAGFPQYNGQTSEIYFDKLEYAVDTKSRLLKTANWLASGYILKKMESLCRYSIKPNIEEGRKSMMPYLNNYSPFPGVFINGEMTSIAFGNIQLTNKAILAMMTVQGKIDVKIDGLK